MGEVAAFALGVLTGLVIYWLVYRVYWLRWRKHMERDLSYLRAKVDSAEFTSFSLDRQLATQKSELAEQRAKISLLERENRLAQTRLEEGNGDKQALHMHLETLRAELSAYKKAMMEPALPALSLPPQPNGKKPAPARPPADPETNKDLPVKAQIHPTAIPLASMPTDPPANGVGSSNGHTNGRSRLPIPPPADQILEPVLVIARPRPCGDRLEIIQGIGPNLAKKLNQAGIVTFLALSQLTPQRLNEVVGARAAKLMDAESVINQAKKLVGDRRPRGGNPNGNGQ